MSPKRSFFRRHWMPRERRRHKLSDLWTPMALAAFRRGPSVRSANRTTLLLDRLEQADGRAGGSRGGAAGAGLTLPLP